MSETAFYISRYFKDAGETYKQGKYAAIDYWVV